MSTNAQRHADLCDAFEQAWQTNPGVELVDFLVPFNEVICGEVITDLIAIDIEFRLREKAFETRKVEDYLAEFGCADENAIQRLAIKEFRLRQQWGDRPDIYEYLDRFPNCSQAMERSLREAALDFCAAVVSIYENVQRVYECRLMLPLEIGRGRNPDAERFSVIRGTNADRLVLAAEDAAQVSRRQLLVEAVAKNRCRILNLGSRNLPVELREPLKPNVSRFVELPVLISLGQLSVRIALSTRHSRL